MRGAGDRRNCGVQIAMFLAEFREFRPQNRFFFVRHGRGDTPPNPAGVFLRLHDVIAKVRWTFAVVSWVPRGKLQGMTKPGFGCSNLYPLNSQKREKRWP